ncbi:MAG TPA: hypothetical protein VF592_12445 [Sphingomonas sp.]|jgi:hypothetical protein|uniref:hypothetical protein n=1 Tax=Sphingomonas sp. TaxID=28214 RepID=UPI002EDA5F16
MTRRVAPRLLLLPVLLLAACGGGSEGANTSDEEAAPPALVQEGVPENLTDDTRNEAVPLEPPPAVAPAR